MTTTTERLPFRPLLVVPQITYWRNADGILHVLLSNRRKATTYTVTPMESDLGGAAFLWAKGDGERYAVLVCAEHSSCDCKGFTMTDACKHLHAVWELLNDGVLETEGEITDEPF